MTQEEVSSLYQQHAVMMSEISNVYVALAVAAFIGLFFLASMLATAAWSVRIVNSRQCDLEGKFTLLIDVLLQQVQRDIEAKQVQVTAETVEVREAHGAN